MSGADEAYLAADGTPCIEDREALLALDYMIFEYDYEKGYAPISQKEGCRLAIADLIRDYHNALRKKGEPVFYEQDSHKVSLSDDGAVSTMYWHEGQIRAFESQTNDAIELFRMSLKPEGDNSRAWNSYVRATIAFLENDIVALKIERENLIKANDPFGVNLNVLDGLIACFGRSYDVAYSSAECNRR